MDANYKMFQTISKHVIQSATALKVLTEGQASLADVIVDNHLAWDSLLAKQWGVCFLNGTYLLHVDKQHRQTYSNSSANKTTG